jgi:hypothetical protein
MTSLDFKCTLQTDLVLNSSPASEGVSKSLNYIPGVKFLGLTAQSLYDEQNPEKTCQLFHDGTVRFGDAHPYVDNGDAFLVPANWYFPKGKKQEGPFYLHQELSPSVIADLVTNEGYQLKRAKDYFLTVSADDATIERITVPQRFTLKTGFDGERRRSRDGQLFGYYAISAGTEWKFTVEVDDDSLIDDIVSALSGDKRIGRSKSAQYGAVNISLLASRVPALEKISSGENILYAVTDLCFYASSGLPTIHPTIEQLHLPAGSVINWEKSRILHRRYTTWNGKRQAQNADRYLISKGSVISITLNGDTDSSVWQGGVGAFRNEGFGRLLPNPVFLEGSPQHAHLVGSSVGKVGSMVVNEIPAVQGQHASDATVLSFIQHSAGEREAGVETLRKVNRFIRDNYGSNLMLSEIKNSQWGQIRQLARRARRYDELDRILFDEKTGQLLAGESQSVWKRHNRAEELSKAAKANPGREIAFLEKLSAELPKWKQA